MCAEFEKILPAAVLSLTPHIDDNNDVKLDLAINVGEELSRHHDNEATAATKCLAQNTTIIKDGGTAVLAVFPKNSSNEDGKPAPGVISPASKDPLSAGNDIDEPTRVAVLFVTARLFPQADSTIP